MIGFWKIGKLKFFSQNGGRSVYESNSKQITCKAYCKYPNDGRNM